MRPLWRAAAVAASIMAMAVASGPFQARGQDGADCQLIKAFAAAVLKQCGNQIRSLTLSLRDIKRALGSDMQGRFFYVCPIQQMCEDEPELWGWFIDGPAWLAGARGEAEIRELLRHAPGVGPVSDDFAKAACEISTVQIAGLDGRAMCYELAPNNLHAVVVVGAAEEIGFALMFSQRSVGWDLLREKVSAITPKFILQRAVGDASLLKWLR